MATIRYGSSSSPTSRMSAPQAESQWWLNLQTQAQIDQIIASQAVQKAELAQEDAHFTKIYDLYKTAFDNVRSNNYSVPDAFKKVVDLFAPGGESDQIIKNLMIGAGQDSIAAAQVSDAYSGMSNSTNLNALKANIIKNNAVTEAGLQEKRLDAYSNAFTNLGQAQLTTQQMKQQDINNLLANYAKLK